MFLFAVEVDRIRPQLTPPPNLSLAVLRTRKPQNAGRRMCWRGHSHARRALLYVTREPPRNAV